MTTGELAHQSFAAAAAIAFTPIRFTPTASIFEGKECAGRHMTITDRRPMRPIATGIAIASALHRLYPKDFAVDEMQRLVRDPTTLNAIKSGTPIRGARTKRREILAVTPIAEGPRSAC